MHLWIIYIECHLSRSPGIFGHFWERALGPFGLGILLAFSNKLGKSSQKKIFLIFCKGVQNYM